MSLNKIGRYEITGELGRGAMGVVYKAVDPNIGRTVAIKTLRLDAHGVDSGELMRRFKNEARAAGLLNHPNIVTVYDAGEDQGIFYIAMECLEGTTLQELLAERRVLEADEVVRFSREICKGLDYAHSHGIVHRDVKPANIMITRAGAVKIMDFGIAKAGGSMTSTGQVLGTPNYMSPEQVKGKQLDGRSDLFSFGVILYEMLTGEKPFAGQNVTTIIYKIVNENPIPPRDLDATIPASLSTIVIKTLAKQPEERYQSGAELVRDLENYESGSARPATAALPQAQAAPSSEKTVALPMRLVSNNTVRVPEPVASPAKAPVAVLQPVPSRGKRYGGLLWALLVVLLCGSLAAGYAYYRTRSKVQQLEAEIRKDETRTARPAMQPATSTPAPVNSPSPAPSPTASPMATETPAAANTGTLDNAAKTVAASTQAEDRSWLKGRHAATPAAPPVGDLAITSQPVGAKVSIDGRNDLNWVTPFKASRLTPGTHTLLFSKDGYEQETRSIEALAGKSVSFSIDLTAVFKATISSNPSGASIWVDGEDSGQVTPAQLTLEKRLHHISVRKAGYKDASVDTRETLSFSPILLSANQASEPGPSSNFLRRFVGSDSIPDGKGLVHIRTVPEGATIVIDGRVAPKKTNARWPADPGIYSIELQMAGYKPVHRNIKVELGKIGNIDEILEKQ